MAGRRGIAAVELAVLLPFIMFLCVIVTDFGRVFYYSQIVESCARNGALYASDTSVQAMSPYASLQAAAVADAPDLSPQPTVTSTTGTDATGNGYVQVPVNWQFKTITGFPGIPSTIDLSRTVPHRPDADGPAMTRERATRTRRAAGRRIEP